MANFNTGLTPLIPDIYDALNTVNRELVGFVPAVYKNSNAERVAVGENLRYPIARESNVQDTTSSMAIPEPTAQNIESDTMTITKSRTAEWGTEGEEELGLNNGPGVQSIRSQQIAQALRALTNEVEYDLAQTALNASRAYGIAGTTPFTTDIADLAQVRKIFADNGSPMTDLNLVMDTTAGASMRSLMQLTDANRAASDTLLRNGVLLDLQGFQIRESAQIFENIAGAGAGYVLNGDAVIGQTVIPVDTGTGAINAGDTITFAGDSNIYIVSLAFVGGAGDLVIAQPGLRTDVVDGTAVTVGASYTANSAFDRNAIHLITRAPALPSGGDAATDRMSLTDPYSGITYEFAEYKGYRRNRYDISMSWGTKAVKPENIVTLLG